jgi:hypothetical protein
LLVQEGTSTSSSAVRAKDFSLRLAVGRVERRVYPSPEKEQPLPAP